MISKVYDVDLNNVAISARDLASFWFDIPTSSHGHPDTDGVV